MFSRCVVRRALLEWRPDIEDPKYRAGTHTTGGGYQKSDSTRQDGDSASEVGELLQNARSRSSEPKSDSDIPATAPRRHDLIDLPEIDVDTGETPISDAEKAQLEAEAPVLSKPVEDIAEDRNWLSHKLLNVRTIISFALAIVILVFIFTRLDINPADTWSTMLTANPFMLLLGFLIYYSAFWLRGLRWRQLIHNVGLDRDKSVNLPNVNGLVEIIYLILVC